MPEQEWYYRIIEISTGEQYLSKANAPVKAEKLCELLGLDGYTAEGITKEEYDNKGENTEESELDT